MDSALLSLAAQTHQQVVFTPSLVAGLRALPLRGSFTAEDALARLLADTNIVVTRSGASTFVLRASPRLSSTPVTSVVSEVQAARPFGAEERANQAGPLASRSGDAARPAPANTVSEIEVTGSHIRGAPSASPLIVLSHADIERSGQTTVADALRILPQNFGGGAGEGNNLTGGDTVQRSTAFGTGLNLRGLGNGATLVLLNGRRMPGSGTFADFADISTIPSVAVARVEVLLDGASAVYGSDAVAGVVNIVTRKDFEGAETRVLAGIGTSGEPAQGQISQTFGQRWTGGGMLVSYELQRRSALPGADRDFAASSDLRRFGGSDFRTTSSFPGNILRPDPVTNALVPTYGIPAGQNGVGLQPSSFQAGVINRQNQRDGEDILPRQTLNAIYLSADQDIGSRLQVTADARFSSRRYKARFAPATSTLTVGRNNPFFVSPSGSTSHAIAYSFVEELRNVTSAGSVETVGGTLGASLQMAGDWRGQAFVTLGQEITELRARNLVNASILNEALGNTADRVDTAFNAARDGFFNPFTGISGSNRPGVLAAIGSGTTISRNRSRSSSVDAQADGTLWQWPAGPLQLAFGAQARHESLVRSGANFVSGGSPTPSTPTDVARNVTGAFAELRAPLVGPNAAAPGVDRLELSIAGRVEHYQGVGTTANPRIGLVWAPSADIQVRGTYSRSFRAPALRELNDPASFSATLLPLGAGRIRTLQLSGGNPDLKPETARSWTGGVDFRPAGLPGLSVGVTGFDIRFRNRIDRPVGANITNALADPNLTAFVSRISPGSSPADLALITGLLNDPAFSPINGVFQPVEYGAIVDSRYVNTSALHVRGIDVTAGYDVDLKGDQIRLGGNASYLFDFEQQITPTSVTRQRVNVANFPVRFRSRVTADWTHGRVTLGGALNYVGPYHTSLGDRIGDQPTFDLQARLSPPGAGVMQGVSVLLNLRNVFDRDPPFYNNAIGLAYDPANADPVGRFVSLRLTRAW